MTPLELPEAPVKRGGLHCRELAAWREDYGLIAGITTREADFGLASAAPTVGVVDRWLTFKQSWAPAFHAVVVARQCHGTDLATHAARASGWHVLEAIDGHLTSQAGLLLTVTVADCVPIYLAQRTGRWLGLLHAGWRGVAQGIVERGIQCVARCAACPVQDIVMHCGVSVCGDCYEVGPEVIAAVTGEAVASPTHLDLRAEVARRAVGVGVARVSVSSWCTSHDAATFYSHRRSRGRDGRQVAYLGLPLA